MAQGFVSGYTQARTKRRTISTGGVQVLHRALQIVCTMPDMNFCNSCTARAVNYPTSKNVISTRCATEYCTEYYMYSVHHKYVCILAASPARP